MPDDKKETKFTKTQQMRDAIKNSPKKSVPQPTGFPAKVAAAASPKKAKKPSDSSAKARDLRAKTRGRLPKDAWATIRWTGLIWKGELHLAGTHGASCKCFEHQADGAFRLMEELDIKFWEWYAKEATDEEKKRLIFEPHPPAPAPWPSPSVPGSTGAASH